MTDDVLVETRDGVMRIVMNRPTKKNALTGPMYDKMTAAMTEAEQSDAVRAIVLEGSGGSFTAGNDLADFLATATQGKENRAGYFIHKIAMLEKPIVAAVDGVAVGVGTTLIFHCDMVFATPGAKFRMPFVDLGLVPEAASSILAPRRLGMARASEYILLAEPFGGRTAHELGLVNHLVEPEYLSGRAMEAAKKLASKPVAALRASRALLREDRSDIEQAIKTESAAFMKALQSPDARKAFEAFLSKSS
jgi:enoyl-CoA hydratase/carnithine racemase